MTGVVVRIALRYLAGALVAKGIIDAEAAYFINTDPELAEAVTAALGFVVGVATEFAYKKARDWGWST